MLSVTIFSRSKADFKQLQYESQLRIVLGKSKPIKLKNSRYKTEKILK